MIKPLPVLLGTIFLVFFSAGLWWFSRRQPGQPTRDVLALFAVALTVRILAAFAVDAWLRIETGTPFLFGLLGDDYRYHVTAASLAHRWSQEGYGLPAVLYTRGFETGLGTLYWLVSPHVWVGKAANIFAGALIPVGTYWLLRQIDSPRSAWLAGVLAALFPPLVFWSTVLYKDTVLTAAILFALIMGFRVLSLRRSWLPALALAGLGTLGIAVLRFQSILIVALALCASAVAGPRLARGTLLGAVARGLTALLAVGLVFVVLRSPTLAGAGPDLLWYLGLDRIDLFYEARSMAFQTRSDSLEGLFLSVPLQFVASFFLPLPLFVDVGSTWQATEHVMLVGNLVWLWVMYYVLFCFWKADHSERRAWLPIVIMVLGTGLGIAIRGYALIYRHKVQMYPFALMLASLAIVRIEAGLWHRNRLASFMYAAGALFVILLYNYVRVGLTSR